MTTENREREREREREGEAECRKNREDRGLIRGKKLEKKAFIVVAVNIISYSESEYADS